MLAFKLSFTWVFSSCFVSHLWKKNYHYLTSSSFYLVPKCNFSCVLSIYWRSRPIFYWWSNVSNAYNNDRDQRKYIKNYILFYKLGYICMWICTCSVASVMFNPVDSSPPGSSVHGILQARIMEWIAISSSRCSSWSRDRTHFCYVFCIGGQVLYP